MNCAPLAMAAVLMPYEVRAQTGAFQGAITGVSGTVDRAVSGNNETLTIGSKTATINWSPYDHQTGGGAIDFLPAGNVATFTSAPGIADYTALNRIIPRNSSRPIALNGSVVSTLQGSDAIGGHIWFYSPGGLVIGSEAVFDVGSLLLTSIDPTDWSANSEGFKATFDGCGCPDAKIQVQPGASINALEEGSYIAMIAPRIEQGGTVRVNGSAAYVAAQQLSMTLNEGLFDIQVDIGTGDSQGIVHTGETSGPASTALNDRQVITMVAVPKNDALTMLLDGGQIGYDEAVSASVENGQVVLSAGYSVSQRSFDGEDLGGAIGATAADMAITGGDFTSSVKAAATGAIDASGGGGTLSFAGDVSLQALQSATLTAHEGEIVTVVGDARVSADDLRDFTTADGELAIDAHGGTAAITAETRGLIDISGSARVSADARGATDSASSVGGNATAGEASIEAAGGSISVGGSANIRAHAFGGDASAAGIGGNALGGSASILVDGGDASFSDVEVDTNGRGGDGGTGGEGHGGTSFVGVERGSLAVSGTLTENANGIGGEGLEGASGQATGGHASLVVGMSDEPSSDGLGIAEDLAASANIHAADLNANAIGGNGLAAVGGRASGGTVEIVAETAHGSLLIDTLGADAKATGGDGADGGDASADAGSITLRAVNDGETENLGAMDIGSATLVAIANGGIGGIDPTSGTANGGQIDIRADGGKLSLQSVSAFVDAQNAGGIEIGAGIGSGGQAGQLEIGTLAAKARGEHGGSIEVSAAAGTVADVGDAELIATGTTDGGHISLLADGTIDASDLLLTSGGDIDVLIGAGGSLDVAGTFEADAIGTMTLSDGGSGGAIHANVIDLGAQEIISTADLEASTVLLAALGDFSVANVEAQDATFMAGGLADFTGTVSAPTITVTSGDINIAQGASLGVSGVTQLLTLNAVSGGSPVVLGDVAGVADGQYQLFEDGAFHADAIIFNAVGEGGGAAPDILVGNFQIGGSDAAGGGVANLTLNTEGSVRVDGDFQFTDLGAGDALNINAGEAIEVNTDSASIALTDSSGALAGTLNLNADNVWIASSALLAQLETDPNFSGRDEALATSGSVNPEGFVRAGGINAAITQTFLVQNGGTADDPSGVTVGEAGLTITNSSQSPATIIVFGRQLNSDGSIIGGKDLVAHVTLAGLSGYTSNSTINGCAIDIACIEPPEALPPEAILGPIGLMDSPLDVDELVSLDLVLTLGDDLVDEPVTSGIDPIPTDEGRRCSKDDVPGRPRCR